MTKDRYEQDHALWTEEIAAWREDHSRALRTLEEATALILMHEAELEDHLREIEEHEEAGAGAPNRVETRREQHMKVRHRHLVVRGRHRGLIEEIMKLQVALHRAGHGHAL